MQHINYIMTITPSDLKDKIESMNKDQQIEVLRLLSNTLHSSALNENNNGTFVNLTAINKNIISQLENYVNYVEEQQNHLSIAEKEMERLDNIYFKGNKEIKNTKIG